MSPHGFGQADYPSAIWNPAYSGNFATSNRPTTYPIEYVVIHITEGSYNGAISWFKNPDSNVSAHYVLRSSDGQVTQMVKEKDMAWHSGVSFFNQRSVGIEHEATSSSPSWYTNALYGSSAQLTRYLTSKYSIPRNRTYIIGHKETGRATSCPGPYWDWDKYMALVLNYAEFDSATVPSFFPAGSSFDVVVKFKNVGGDTWLSSGSDRVYLGTTNPENYSSPFYTSGNWIAPSRPAAVFTDTPDQGIGEFKFRMTAPSTPGQYTETYQLTRNSTGWFGPVVTFVMDVGQFDKVLDNNSSSFSVVGTWSTGTTAAGRYGDDYRFHATAAKSKDVAMWSLNVPTSGSYDVYVWWSQGTNRAKEVTYEVAGVREPLVRTFDQTKNGGQWMKMGRVRLREGTGVVKMLATSSDVGKVAIADAVRLVGPF